MSCPRVTVSGCVTATALHSFIRVMSRAVTPQVHDATEMTVFVDTASATTTTTPPPPAGASHVERPDGDGSDDGCDDDARAQNGENGSVGAKWRPTATSVTFALLAVLVATLSWHQLIIADALEKHAFALSRTSSRLAQIEVQLGQALQRLDGHDAAAKTLLPGDDGVYAALENWIGLRRELRAATGNAGTPQSDCSEADVLFGFCN